MAWPETFRTYRQNTIFLGWMKSLPEEIIHTRPVLCAGYAWALQDLGEFENADHWLNQAENPPDAAVLFMDEAEFLTLPGNIAVARAYIAMAMGNAIEAEQQARRALGLLPEDDLFRRAGAIAMVGMACLQNGDMEAAARAILDGMEMAEKAGSPEIALSGAFPLVDIRLVQGRLSEAVKIFENLLAKISAPGKSIFSGTPDLYLGLCGLRLEQGDVETARQFLQKSDELGEPAGLPDWHYRSCLTHARYLEILGDLDGAVEQMKEAEHLFTPSALPNLRPPNALRARLMVKKGQTDEALAWAREQGLSLDSDLIFFQEFGHLTLARILCTRCGNNASIVEVLEFLNRLLKAAEAGGRTGSVIEILILQALAFQAQGDIHQAFTSLERALALAEPEGYLRIFVDEGEAMNLLILGFRTMIEKQGHLGVHPLLGYTNRLLAAFPKSLETISQTEITNQKPKIVETLTDRELEILHLIAEGQSNAEISQQLFVALSTVKGHNLRIFNKLQAQNRTEAVARAHELGLI